MTQEVTQNHSTFSLSCYKNDAEMRVEPENKGRAL